MIPFLPTSDSFAILHEKLVTLLAEVTAPRHGNLPDDALNGLAESLGNALHEFKQDWLAWEAQNRKPMKVLPFDVGPNASQDSNWLTRDWS